MEIIEFTLPAYWASAIINGDFSGLQPGEAADVQYWLDTEPDIGGDALSCTDEEEFVHYHDAGDFACMCLTFSFPKKVDANTLSNMLDGTAPDLRHRQ